MASQKTLLIRNGRLLDPASGRDEVADMLIRGGKIATTGKRLKRPEGAEVLDAIGKVVTPGLVDMHVHLREPGREDEETILTGGRAAAAGGFTAVACMPNTEPPLDNQEAVRFVCERASLTPVHVYPIGAITRGRQGKELTEVADLVAAGAVAVSDDGDSVLDAGIFRRALEYASMFDIPVISHCEDVDLRGSGVMHEGYLSTVLGLQGIPDIVEEVMVARDIRIAEFTGAHLHIAHLSSAGSVELIREAKARGVSLSAEVTPHHLALTDESVRGYDPNTKVNPPLRGELDRQALRDGLVDGTIDCVASDHAPHAQEEKELEYDAAPFGMLGLETSLGLVLTELVKPGALTLMEAVAKMSLNPARILGIDGGAIRKGAAADLTVIDPELRWIVDKRTFQSRSKNTPFDGWELTGCAVATIVEGQIVFRRQQSEETE
jgi:dihydroorotase